MRDLLIIEGGVRLAGTVRASSAKNAVLPMMAASILTGEECVLRDVPRLRDVGVMGQILSSLGAEVRTEAVGDRSSATLTIVCRSLSSHVVPADLMGEVRSSIFLMGALLARNGRADLAYPGGCSIGHRPIDLHLQGLRDLGAKIEEHGSRIEAEARELHGSDIRLTLPSVGATENIMMAAVLATGTTLIRNAAREPEIVDLQNMLNLMGASISGAGGEAIRIEGVRRLHGVSYVPIPDRIEAGTLMVAAAITSGQVEVSNCVPDHLRTLIDKLRQAGCTIEEGDRRVFVEMDGRPRAVDCVTLPYPGFPTDLQPPLMSLAAIADGTSAFLETIYEQRFNQAEGLQRMGADISITGQRAFVHGVERLRGAAVRAHDLRAGAALVLAGLVADGVTTVSGIEHIDRGYDGLETKLASLGASVRRACA
ncbi:MAG: UDP-N-acetylglucosamine 1-carboxyvinyltransferase [Bacillota bacterium]|nr:UDP-N-acetylglucosamine 1-carboxyvinyltransferase [Bacillota bacterium]